jgi:hypothetical protein
VLFLYYLAFIKSDCGVQQGTCESAQYSNKKGSLFHTPRDFSTDVVEFSTEVAIDTWHIFRVNALCVEQSEKEMAEASANYNDCIDEKTMFGVVVIA